MPRFHGALLVKHHFLMLRHVALSHEASLAEDRLSAFLNWARLEGHLAS